MQCPDDEAENDGMASVTSKRQECHEHHRPCCVSEAYHTVWSEREAAIADHGFDGIERPPDLALGLFSKVFSILGGRMENPRHQSDITKDVQASIKSDNDHQQQDQTAIFDTTKLCTILRSHAAEIRVSSSSDRL